MSRRPKIPIRKRIFVGCEGESEQSYVALLSGLAQEAGVYISISNQLLRPGGGDPLALVELAIEKIDRDVRLRGVPFAYKSVILDADTVGNNIDRDERARLLARRNEIDLLWQEPCHEGLLLVHLDGCENLKPPSAQIAIRVLLQHWPGYRKAAPAAFLRERIDIEAVFRAAQAAPNLARLLVRLGLLP